MTKSLVGVVMGSNSDWEVMCHAAAQLAALDIPYEARVVSAHRTPDLLFAYAEGAQARGLACIPVATFAIGAAGAANAALFAAALLALHDSAIAQRLQDFRQAQMEAVKEMNLPCLA